MRAYKRIPPEMITFWHCSLPEICPSVNFTIRLTQIYFSINQDESLLSIQFHSKLVGTGSKGNLTLWKPGKTLQQCDGIQIRQYENLVVKPFVVLVKLGQYLNKSDYISEKNMKAWWSNLLAYWSNLDVFDLLTILFILLLILGIFLRSHVLTWLTCSNLSQRLF